MSENFKELIKTIQNYPQEQRQLLLELFDLYCTNFRLEMIDSWSNEDYKLSTNYFNKISLLEKRYVDKYGQTPGVKDITDIIAVTEYFEKQKGI